MLQGATIQAARLMQREGKVGQIVAGAWADVVVGGDPTVDITLLGSPTQAIRLLLQCGSLLVR